jgi:CheY-like chemotaxis protein
MASFMAAFELSGFGVMGATGLPVARALLTQFKPDVLVTSLRLGEYNGFQLVMMLRQEHGTVPTFVVGEADLLTEAQAERAGAQLITETLPAPDLAALIMRAFRLEAPRRWRRIRPHRPVVAEVRGPGGQSTGTGVVVDIGLGGMGLKLSELAEGLPGTLEVTLPAYRVTVPAEHVWHREQDAEIRCGVVVPLATPGSNGTWAKIVEHFRRAERRRGHASSQPALSPLYGLPTEMLPPV